MEEALFAAPSLTAARARSRLAYIQPLWTEYRKYHLWFLDKVSEEERENHVYFKEKQFATRKLQYLRIVDVMYEAMTLHCLKSCLDSDGAALFKNIPVTAANFKTAWDLLEARFASQRSLVLQLLTQLFAFPALKIESVVAL